MIRPPPTHCAVMARKENDNGDCRDDGDDWAVVTHFQKIDHCHRIILAAQDGEFLSENEQYEIAGDDLDRR